VPEGVDADKIEAGFKTGILTVILPKMAGARRHQKMIAVKSG
jgi:HSP20 family protein